LFWTGQVEAIMRVAQMIKKIQNPRWKVVVGCSSCGFGEVFGERVARIGKPDVDVERVSTRLELAKDASLESLGDL
jgi:predicted nucleic-acid-binding Zn-ribbon protein